MAKSKARIFADLADNAGEARVKLLNVQKRYGLLDI